MRKIIGKKPLILAIETSGRTGSAALALADTLLSQITFETPIRHSSELFPAIAKLLADSSMQPTQIAQIYISIGPGSFTGLRIAATLAKTFSLANPKTKIIAVDTLDCIAANAADYIQEKNAHIPKIAAIIDAKRGQFFIAAYSTTRKPDTTSPTGFRKILDDCLLSPDKFLQQFAHPDKPIWLLGEGLLYYKQKFTAEGINFIDQNYWTPKASNIHRLGCRLAQQQKFADPLTLQPKYLRIPDIKLKKS